MKIPQTKYFDSDPLFAIKQGYTEKTRMLSFHSLPIPAQDLREALGLIGQYNDFDPETVASVLLKNFPDCEFVVGRENSPVIYVLITPLFAEDFDIIKTELRADEADFGKQGLRLWWD